MNVLFITADQWRGKCLSALGRPVIETPNLDMLASEGVLFKKHYAQATPCSPSRTSLHTGMYLHNHRVCLNGTPFDEKNTNWAQETRNAGYKPFLFGYTDTGKDPRGLKKDDPRLRHYSEPLPGIETNTVYANEVPLNWVNHLKSRGYSIPSTLWDLYSETTDKSQTTGDPDSPPALKIKSKDHETGFMVNQCIDWIKRQQGDWVTHLSLFRPHPPFVAPNPYNSLYSADQLDPVHRQIDWQTEASQHPWLAYQLGQKKFRAPQCQDTFNKLKSSYYGLIKEVDDYLGFLFDAIHQLGQWNDTLIIFTSDHGEQMGDHWLMSKSGYFDSSYHVPLIIRDPRNTADPGRGCQVESFTENIDIMPTILEVLDLDIPGQCDGYSLLPFIATGKAPSGWRQEVHWEYDFRDVLSNNVEAELNLTQHQCSLNVIRDDYFKYVHFTALPPLFFDLTKDPNELKNVAEDPTYQKQVLIYAQKLISWRMNHDEKGLTETYLSENGPVTRQSPRHRVGL